MTPLPPTPGTVATTGPAPVAALRAFRPAGPDADWETVRARLAAALTLSVGTTWTDHNAVDPGVTLTEAAALGLADLHYRTAARGFEGWPLEVADWLPEGERHWASTLPVGSTAALADALAAPAPTGGGSVAQVLAPLVAACAAPDEATALLAAAPWAGVVPAAAVPAALALLRWRRVRQLALEHSDVVAGAVDAQAGSGGTLAERDARAAAELAFALPLWPAELAALVRRERRRRTAAAVLERFDEVVAATTTASAAAVRARLVADGLTAAEAAIALRAVSTPVDTVPEDLERADGSSLVWPPHPLQALTCEPVTDLDYARRARSHPEVGRAWAVPGRLVGVGWDGAPVLTASQAAGSVTLVVERSRGTGPTVDFLRDVLAVAIGSEVRTPHPTWQDTLDPRDPRRMICDEVGAALLAHCPVVLQGTLVTGVGVDRAATLAAALGRVAGYLTAGRASRRTPADPGAAAGPAIEGPWPRVDQPSSGWVPGEPVRFAEVVRALTADPAVLGVEDLSIKAGSGPLVPSTAGSVPLAPDCVPVLAAAQCLWVRFALTGDCS